MIDAISMRISEGVYSFQDINEAGEKEDVLWTRVG